MEKLKYSLVILIVVFFKTEILAHDGHDHGESAPQENFSSGPISLSEEAKKNLEIKLAEATVQAIEKTIKANGTIQPVPGSRETISSTISGKIADLAVNIGQRIKKGDRLLTLEARQISETPIEIKVLAPRSGKIVKLNVIKGDAVEPGTGILEIADYREVYAVAQVNESQISNIKKGMSARIYSPVLKNNEMNSKVEIIGNEVNAQSRAVEIWLRIKNQDERLKINMNVNVFFLSNQNDQTITVPRIAVLGRGGDKFVFVVDGNKYVRTEVVTGDENDKWIEIIDGVAPGDSVVTQGNYQLQFAKAKGK